MLSCASPSPHGPNFGAITLIGWFLLIKLGNTFFHNNNNKNYTDTTTTTNYYLYYYCYYYY